MLLQDKSDSGGGKFKAVALKYSESAFTNPSCKNLFVWGFKKQTTKQQKNSPKTSPSYFLQCFWGEFTT